MASLSKDRYLVLFVDDSRPDCLFVRLAVGESERLNFIGDVCNSTDSMTSVQGAEEPSVKIPWADLLQMDFLMPRRRGVEVLDWLQSQPFKDLVVMVLPVVAEPEDFRTAYEVMNDDGANNGAEPVPGTTDLLEFLREYAASRSGSK